MKYGSLFLILSRCLLAYDIFSSKETLDVFKADIEVFYDDYTYLQEGLNATVDLGKVDTGFAIAPVNPPVLPAPPADPSLPATGPAGYLPFVIVNTSGIPDDEVFISIIGAQLIGTVAQTQKIYVTFSGSGVGTYNNVPSVGDGSITPVALTSINAQTTGQPHTYAILCT